MQVIRIIWLYFGSSFSKNNGIKRRINAIKRFLHNQGKQWQNAKDDEIGDRYKNGQFEAIRLVMLYVKIVY